MNRADLALAVVSFIWGASFVIVKGALQDVSAIYFVALRFLVATAVLAVIFRKRVADGFTAAELRAGALAGAWLIAGYVLQTVGLRTTTPSKSAFLTGFYIPLTPLLGSFVFKRGSHWREVLGVAIAFAGTVLLAMPEGSLAVGMGELLTIGCAVAFALHILTLGHFSGMIQYESLSFLQVAAAAMYAWGGFWWLEAVHLTWSGAVLLALVVGGVFSTAIAFTVQSWAQQYTTPTRTALIFSLEPVFAWVTAFAMAGELLSGRATAGALLILAGIVLVEMKPGRGKVHPC
jgi:drug/metabolite transporter (DMT)-like permease